MFAPPLYEVRKFSLHDLISSQFQLPAPVCMDPKYRIKQQDNMLFRQIRLVTGDKAAFSRWIVFVNCGKNHGREEQITNLVLNGFTAGGQSFTICERSASMTRNAMLCFVDSSIAGEIEQRVSMNLFPQKTVLSKWYAYRGLMLSSCHCLEGFRPKIIVIPDCYRSIEGQHIKCLADEETEYENTGGEVHKWMQKTIKEAIMDIEINVFDGCGLHHPELSQAVQERIHSAARPTSILWRAPFIKGMTHEMDYVRFFRERGIEAIMDIWGVHHSVLPGSEPMIILCESMYKGLAYFRLHDDFRDFEAYLEQFHKFNHCLGIAKWNYDSSEEPVYTRANYQILQDLNLPYEDFARLAEESINWITKIIEGDELYTYCFLGLVSGRQPADSYGKAILKNPAMLKEQGVRKHLISLLKKYIDDMKCGKLWMKGSFKFLCPDLIMLMEHMAEIPPKGCLESNEFYAAQGVGDACTGEYAIERNPHICKSEHVVLSSGDNRLLQQYCGHLVNVCMVSGNSIVPKRLNGADMDGDLVFLTNNSIFLEGIDRTLPAVMDMDDKIAAAPEENTPEHHAAVILRTMKNLIGEYSNYASAYHNKMPGTMAQRQKYDSYIEIISILTGKSIDYAKTGVLYSMPRHIAKYGRPLPYFMKYRSAYYESCRLSRSNSNMNRLCREIEKWEKTLHWKQSFAAFDYHVMLDPAIPFREKCFRRTEEIFLEFCREMKELGFDQKSIREEEKDFILNWDYYYDQYRRRCREICPDPKELANYAVLLCYEKHPTKNKKFLWRIAGEGVAENVREAPAPLPAEDPSGPLTYLGRRYRLDAKEE